MLEQVSDEAEQLLAAVLDRARPFTRSLPDGLERRQATGFVLTKT